MNERITGLCACLSAGLLDLSGAETVYDTTQVIQFAIDGKLYRKAAVADGATPTTDGDGNALTALAASQGCVVLWCLKADGTVGVFQSRVVALDATGAFAEDGGVPQFPAFDQSVWVPFAYAVLKNGSNGSTWTHGSSNWNATGLSVAAQDLATLPSRPQES